MIFRIIDLVFQVYLIMIFIRIISSWFPEFQKYKWMAFINFYTDPYLNFFRNFIPPLGMLDLSPLVAIFCLSYLESFTKMIVGYFIR